VAEYIRGVGSGPLRRFRHLLVTLGETSDERRAISVGREALPPLVVTRGVTNGE
jgi:hypothetical protein